MSKPCRLIADNLTCKCKHLRMFCECPNFRETAYRCSLCGETDDFFDTTDGIRCSSCHAGTDLIFERRQPVLQLVEVKP